jgi:hypothetical protein
MYWLNKREFHTACERWQEVSGDQKAFERFVGLTVGEVVRTGSRYAEVTPEVTRKIQMILGPHYVAIIKAYLINTKLPQKSAK